MHLWKLSIILLITIIQDKLVNGQDGSKSSGVASGSNPPESTGSGSSSQTSSDSGPGSSPGSGPGSSPGSGPGSSPGSGPGSSPGSGPGSSSGSGPGSGPGSSPGSGPGSRPGSGPGSSPGQGPPPMGGIKPFIGKGPNPGGFPPFPPLPEGCKSISGIWYNEVGSMLNLTQNPDGNLSGEFYTLRESDPTVHKSVKATIVGVVSTISNSILFGFAVSWGENLRSTAWIGECYICNGTEVLETNWISRESVDECNDKWHANRVGHSSFTKEAQKHLKTEDIATNDLPPVPPSPPTTESSSNCSVTKLWYNELGAKMDLEEKNKIIIGTYELPEIVRMSGNAKVVGSLPYNSKGTSALVSLNAEGKVITLWIGQCLVCGTNSQEVFDSYVANRLWVPSCLEEFRTTAYGANKFTKINMAPPMSMMKPNADHQDFPLNQEHGPDTKQHEIVPIEGLGDIQGSKYDVTNTSTTTKPE